MCGQRDCDLSRCRRGFPVRLSHFFELWALFLAPVIQNTDKERNDGMWRWAGPGWALQAPLSGVPISDYRPCSGPCPCGTHHRSDQGKGPHKARLPLPGVATPCGRQILTWPRPGQSLSHPWPGARTGLLPEGKAENNWKPGGWCWASPSSLPKPVSCLANVSSPIRPETAQCPMVSHITHPLCPPPPLRNQSLRKGLIITLKWKLPTKLSVSYQRDRADFNRVCGKTLLQKFQA